MQASHFCKMLFQHSAGVRSHHGSVMFTGIGIASQQAEPARQICNAVRFWPLCAQRHCLQMQISSTDLFHHLSDFFQNPLISREPLYGIQFVFCQPACGFGFFQNKVARENHAPEAVHRKMKCRIVVFNGSNLIMYRDFSVQLFLNFSFQRLLWSLARFDFAARKFPLPL